jgi:hypothetical protein
MTSTRVEVISEILMNQAPDHFSKQSLRNEKTRALADAGKQFMKQKQISGGGGS